jgi:hypothetical protein
VIIWKAKGSWPKKDHFSELCLFNSHNRMVMVAGGGGNSLFAD